MSERIQDKIAGAAILLIVFGGCIINMSRLGDCWRDFSVSAFAEAGQTDGEEPIPLSHYFKEFNSIYTDHIKWRSALINLNGLINKKLGVRSMYSSDGIHISATGYIQGWYPETSTDYETEEVIDFYHYLSDRGTCLIYVNEPIKYLDDAFILADIGKASYGNANADRLLGRLQAAGIYVIDIREEIAAAGLNIDNFFYRTDHHWTVPAGLMCAGRIAAGLNERCAYHIPENLFDTDNYETIKYENAWLGEQGRKVAASYVGLDDYTEVKPVFDTDFTVMKDGTILAAGRFEEVMVKESIYEQLGSEDYDLYDSPSWHYSYAPFGLNGVHIINHNVTEGKLLYLGDSYDHCVIPFLALGIHEIDAYIMRGVDGSIRDVIKENEYDTVVIAYAASMIGCHNAESNVNYRMFDFE